MIITNWIATVIVWIADKINKDFDIIGVTIWPFIFIAKIPCENYSDSKIRKLVKHEYQHLKQWKRYWIVGFLPVYIFQYFKYGYWEMPLEQEARKAEDE